MSNTSGARSQPCSIFVHSNNLQCAFRAHASGAPWQGQNALDAAFLAYAGLSVLRQQLEPGAMIHGTIYGRDWTPNGRFKGFIFVMHRSDRAWTLPIQLFQTTLNWYGCSEAARLPS